MAATTPILPTPHHFEALVHETEKSIFAKAIERGFVDEENCTGPLIKPVVEMPFQVLVKVTQCVVLVFLALISLFEGSGKEALYHLACAVVLYPLRGTAEIAAQIVRIAASILGVVSTSIALHGWWCAEVIELTALAACTGLYSVLNFQPSGRPLLDQDIEPKNAVEFFGVVNSRKYALRDNNARLSPVEPVKNMVLELWKGHRELATELLFNTTEGVPSRTQDILQTKITKQEQEGEGQDPVLTIADISAYEATLLYNHLATRTAHRDEIRTQFEKRSGPVFLAGRAAWRALKSWNDFGTASHYQ